MKFPTIKEMAEEVAEKALDEFEYKGKTLREWVKIILATDINVGTKDGTNLAEVGTDCISREQAIDALRKMQTYKMFSGDDMLLIDQAGAQTELMLLPPIQPSNNSENPNSSDVISRQAAKEAVRMVVKDLPTRTEINILINDLPSAQPERKTGKWIYITDGYYEHFKCEPM